MSAMAIFRQLRFAGQRLDNTSHTLHDSGHLLEIHFVGRVERSVIVRIPEWGRVGDHNRRVASLARTTSDQTSRLRASQRERQVLGTESWLIRGMYG